MDRIQHRGHTVVRRNASWRVRVRFAGELVQLSEPTVEGALSKLDALLDRRELQTRSVGSHLSISALSRRWLERQTHLAPATRKSYEIHLRVHITPKIGSLDANLVRPLELEDFYRQLTYATAQKCHMVLRGAFAWGIRNEHLSRPSNPTYAVRPTRRMCADHDGYFGEDDDFRPVSEKDIPKTDDIRLLIKDALDRRQRWWWLYLVVATTTGARPGEICALRRADFDFDANTLRIEWTADKVSKRLKRPKTPWSVRTLRLAPEFFEAISPHLPTDPNGFLFPSDEARGSELPCRNSRSIERKLGRRLRALGLPHYTPHGFRHYVATHLLDECWPPLQVGRFLGHRDDQMVRKLYGAHIVDETQRGIGEAASRWLAEIDR